MFLSLNINKYRFVNILSLFIALFVINTSSYALKMSVEGIYRGENLYVMNPFSSSGIGFCVSEVRVNGQVTTDEINSSAFEIDFSSLDLHVGDKIIVEIIYKDGCLPKILNPEVLKPKSTYIIQYITVDKAGVLKWATTNEKGVLDFEVEEFRWNKWRKIGTVPGKGTPDKKTYSTKVDFHSGINKFRVKQTDYSNKPNISAEAKFMSLIAEVTFTPGNGKIVTKDIIFSAVTDYEIYNYYGSLVRKGTSSKIDVSNLKKGNYYLNYDNMSATFIKK